MLPSEFSGNRAPRVVIAGGGVAALEAMIALHQRAPGALDVTVVAPARSFTYRPLLVGEPFGYADAARYSLERLCADNGARLLPTALAAVRADEHRIDLADGTSLGYDALLVAIGARAVPAFEHGVSFDRETAPEDFAEVLTDLHEGLAPRIAIVVPATVTWTLPAYELALLTAAGRAGDRQPAVSVVTHEPAPLCAFGSAVSEGVRDLLGRSAVSVRCGVRAEVLSHTALEADGEWVATDRIVALPHLSGSAVAGLPHDLRGFIPVDEFGRVRGACDVYAAGDGTNVEIKQGGLAAQLADVAARHILSRTIGAEDPEPFRPVLRGLLSTIDGPRYLRAELDDIEASSTISVEPLWWPPSKISSRWLAPYLARLDAARRLGSPPSLGSAHDLHATRTDADRSSGVPAGAGGSSPQR